MIGDLNSQSTKDFEDAVAKADLDLAQGAFPAGENTMLSREFDGVDLSGGQWQRVAIARGFFSQPQLDCLG